MYERVEFTLFGKAYTICYGVYMDLELTCIFNKLYERVEFTLFGKAYTICYCVYVNL